MPENHARLCQAQATQTRGLDGFFYETGVSGRDPALRGLLAMLTYANVCCAAQKAARLG
jgi:hypothetical protein